MDDFDSEAYFGFKAQWENFFGALGRVADAFDSEEESDAFWNALDDWRDEQIG